MTVPPAQLGTHPSPSWNASSPSHIPPSQREAGLRSRPRMPPWCPSGCKSLWHLSIYHHTYFTWIAKLSDNDKHRTGSVELANLNYLSNFLGCLEISGIKLLLSVVISHLQLLFGLERDLGLGAWHLEGYNYKYMGVAVVETSQSDGYDLEGYDLANIKANIPLWAHLL